MRVAVITNGYIPFPTGFGSAVHVSSLIQTLWERGHEVHICCYAFDSQHAKASLSSEAYQRSIGDWTDKGIRIHTINVHPAKPVSVWKSRLNVLRKTVAPRVDDFFGGVHYRDELSCLLTKLAPDALCPWMVDGVAATAPPLGRDVPRMAFMTDLDYLTYQYRRRFRPAKSLSGRLYQRLDSIAERKLPAMMISLLKDCESVYDHAAHHCQWLRDRGVSQANYEPVPVLDKVGANWKPERETLLSQNRIPKISLIGNVSGIATLPGITLTAREILPALERLYGTDGFELHVIGGGKLPEDLAAPLSRPYVKRRGYVDDIRAEFQSSDIFLVPTPTDGGFRTRIAEAFSYGCCVVAHTANSVGMPELVHERNALLAGSGSGLAEAIVRCLRDPALRTRLGDMGRRTYEHVLDGRVVCNRMADTLSALIRPEA
jgi:glycosyltransferase involved in cell wall biosynthesis